MSKITIEKVSTSAARKNLHKVWAAKTLFTTSNGRHVELSTWGERGKISSSAQLGDYKGSDGSNFSSFSFMMFQDQSWPLANENVGRVSENAVNAQHVAAVEKFEAMELEV